MFFKVMMFCSTFKLRFHSGAVEDCQYTVWWSSWS